MVAGPAGELVDLIGDLPEYPHGAGPIMRLFGALASLQAGDPAPARTALERDLPSQVEAGYSPFPASGLAMLAELALHLDEHAAMAILHRALGPWSGLHANWTIGFYLGPFDLYLGRLGAALGDEPAVPSLEAALRFVEAVDARPLVMATKEALAGALERRGDPDDVAQGPGAARRGRVAGPRPGAARAGPRLGGASSSAAPSASLAA